METSKLCGDPEKCRNNVALDANVIVNKAYCYIIHHIQDAFPNSKGDSINKYFQKTTVSNEKEDSIDTFG